MLAQVAKPVLSADLPVYPIGRDVRLQSHYFTMIQHHRWLNSEMHLTADMAVQGAALNLFFVAQSQSPLGTLPNDDVVLSRLLRIDLTTWRGLRDRPMGALHRWHPCLCGDEVRLMHPVVLEVLQDAIARRDVREASNEEKAVDARLRRLRAALAELGCSKTVIADEVLIGRLDAWLVENVRGQRRASAYEAALAHAAAMGWLDGGVRHRKT
jgi:hypothetical protein